MQYTTSSDFKTANDSDSITFDKNTKSEVDRFENNLKIVGQGK